MDWLTLGSSLVMFLAAASVVGAIYLTIGSAN